MYTGELAAGLCTGQTALTIHRVSCIASAIIRLLLQAHPRMLANVLDAHVHWCSVFLQLQRDAGRVGSYNRPSPALGRRHGASSPFLPVRCEGWGVTRWQLRCVCPEHLQHHKVFHRCYAHPQPQAACPASASAAPATATTTAAGTTTTCSAAGKQKAAPSGEKQRQREWRSSWQPRSVIKARSFSRSSSSSSSISSPSSQAWEPKQ